MSQNENMHVQGVRNSFLLLHICKFVTFLLPLSSWFLKLPNDNEDKTKGEFLDPLRDFSFLRNEELQPKQCHLQNGVSVCPVLIFLIGILTVN